MFFSRIAAVLFCYVFQPNRCSDVSNVFQPNRCSDVLNNILTAESPQWCSVIVCTVPAKMAFSKRQTNEQIVQNGDGFDHKRWLCRLSLNPFLRNARADHMKQFLRKAQSSHCTDYSIIYTLVKGWKNQCFCPGQQVHAANRHSRLDCPSWAAHHSDHTEAMHITCLDISFSFIFLYMYLSQ